MRTKITLISIIVALIAALIFGYSKFKDVQNNADNLRINLLQQKDSLTTVYNLSKREMLIEIRKNYELDSLLKAEKIKKKDVRTVTVTKNHYQVDTFKIYTNNPISLNDSTYLYPFNKTDGCAYIVGNIEAQTPVNPIIHVDKLGYNNETTQVVHLKKEWTGRKFLWIFKINKKIANLHTESTCGTNTVKQVNVVKD